MGNLLGKHLKNRIHILREKLAALEQGEKKAAKEKRNNDASEVGESSEETWEETMDEMVDRGRRSNHEAKVHDLCMYSYDKHCSMS